MTRRGQTLALAVCEACGDCESIVAGGIMPFLSGEQRAGIVDRLRKNKKYALPVMFVGEEVQGETDVHELAEVLREGGWQVSGPAPPASQSMPSVFVGVDDLRRPNPCARLLVDVLIAVGIRTKLVQMTQAGPAHCCLVIEELSGAEKDDSHL
jgi:hypothetical protein